VSFTYRNFYGIKPPSGTDDAEVRRLALLQFSALLGIVSMLGYAGLHLVVSWQTLGANALLSLGCIPCYGLVMVLNRQGYPHLAKVVFCTVLTGSMFLATYVFLGKTPGMHFFFLLAALVPLLYWELKRFVPIFFFMALSLAGFSLVEFRSEEIGLLVPTFPPHWVAFYNAMSFLATFVTVVVLLVYFQFRADTDAKNLDQRARLMEALMHQYEALSKIDPLTELLNRRAILAFLDDEAVRMNRNHLGFAVLLLDIDFFKNVNDSHGHQAGDAVLKAFSAILTGSLREVDRVGRWGGEEFLVLLPDTPLEGALVVAEKIRSAVANHRFPVGAFLLDCTVTIGVALHDVRSGDIDATIRRADLALYRGKEAGRNRVMVADPLPSHPRGAPGQRDE